MSTNSMRNLSAPGKRSFHIQGETAFASTMDPTAIEILSEAGHDLRSPIAGIRAAIQEVANESFGPLNQAQAELLQDAVVQCDSLLGMSEQMLSSDRLRRSNPGTQQSWFVPNELVRSLKRGIQASANLKRIAVHWDGFERLPARLYGDRIAIERLIYNLAGNAIQVSPENSSIQIALQSSSGDSGIAEIAISDAGLGISPIALETISRRGFSGQNRTGLGLAICRALAASQLTPIRIRSLQSGGSQISFEIATGDIGSVAKLFTKWRKTLLVAARAVSTTANAVQTEKEISSPLSSALSRTIPEGTPRSNASNSNASNSNMSNAVSIRVDPAMRSPLDKYGVEPPQGNSDKYFPIFEHLPEHLNSVVVTQIHLPLPTGSRPGYTSETVNEIDRFVQNRQRYHELAYRYDEVHWFMIWDCSIQESLQRQEQFLGEFKDRFDIYPVFEKPLTLEFPQIDCDSGATFNLVHELMIRTTLLGRLPRVNNRYRGAPLRRRERHAVNAATRETNSTTHAMRSTSDTGNPTEWNRVNQEIRQLRRQLVLQSQRLSTQAERLNQSVAAEP